MYLVALWTTMSAPCSIGRWSSGVAKVLSTTSSVPASRVAAAAAMSATAISGLLGVSSQTIAAPRAASATACASAMSTQRTVSRPIASRARS